MSVQLIVNAILTIFLPFAIGIVYWYSRALAQGLPEHQRAALEQFARMSVQCIEQQYPNDTAQDKHTLALALVDNLFKAHHLPTPTREVVDVAIRSAMYEASAKQG